MARRPEQTRARRHGTPSGSDASPEAKPVDAPALLGNAAMAGLLGDRSAGVDPAATADGLRRGGDPAPFLRAATASGDLGFARAYLDAVRGRRTHRPLGLNREDEEEEEEG